MYLEEGRPFVENSNNTGNTMNSKTYSVPGDERSLLSIYLSFPQYIPNDLVIEEEDFELEDVAQVLMENYGITPEMASADAAKWVDGLKNCGIIG
jgi:hypothetical protein